MKLHEYTDFKAFVDVKKYDIWMERNQIWIIDTQESGLEILQVIKNHCGVVFE